MLNLEFDQGLAAVIGGGFCMSQLFFGNSPKTHVLHLKENLDQPWVDLRQAAMDRLKSENEALLNHLKDLEDSGVRLGGAGC